ncbi:MAG: hypothetical protein A3E83_02405 [Gammaproteobacteria bacterium RIFCSPHIGHO2_12_FULL_41_20]|nr:MAG: hypothetical protein A3E83_02405 [Gammaproteobacteria bacterium RIFCSPHIGHO2_12_FULL_41_20]
MKPVLLQNQLIIKQSPLHGYGVFAGKDIEKGELIEECYTLLVPKGYNEFVNYYFADKQSERWVLALGFGSLYNHSSDKYNAHYIFDPNTNILIFRAQQFIRKGEEILIFYSVDWFRARKMQEKKLLFRTRLKHWLAPSRSLLMRASLVIVGYLAILYAVKKWLPLYSTKFLGSLMQ